MVNKIILELPADTVGGDILVSTETRERAEQAVVDAEAQVALAAGQVGLAAAQVTLASGEADRAEAARDQAEVFAAGTSELQDAAVAGLFSDPDSDTVTALVSPVNHIIGEKFMDIRDLGCREGNPGAANFENASRINTFITEHPGVPIFVPEGDWYLEETLHASGSEIYCVGWFHARGSYVYEDDTVVKLGYFSGTNSQGMINARNYTVKVQGNWAPVVGVSICGFFGSKFTITTRGCMKIGVETIWRNIECEYWINFYGINDSNYSEVGVRFGDGDVDNVAHVIGRNAEIGIDCPNNLTVFSYIHVWGCDVGIKLYDDCRTTIQFFYNDYNLHAIEAPTTAPNKLYVYIGSLFSIGRAEHKILNADAQIGLRIDQLIFRKVDTAVNMSDFALFTTSWSRFALMNSDIRWRDTLQMNAGAMNSFTLQQITDRWGPVYEGKLPKNLKVRFPNFTGSGDYLESTYFENMEALGFRQLVNRPAAFPQLDEVSWVVYQDPYAPSFNENQYGEFWYTTNILIAGSLRATLLPYAPVKIYRVPEFQDFQ